MHLNISPTPNKLLFFLIVLILQSFLSKMPLFYEIGMLGFVDELVVFAMVVVIAASTVPIIFKNKILAVLFSIFIFYTVVGVLSSLFGEVLFYQAVYQYVLDLKFFVVVFFCILSYRKHRTALLLDAFFKVAVILNVFFVIFQIISPGLYDSVFSSGSHFGMVYTQTGGELSRTAGFFWFTGTLALFAALAVGYFYFKLRLEENKAVNLFFLLISIFLLASTLSRGEISSCVISLMIVSFIASKHHITKSTVFIISIILFFSVWASYTDIIGQSLAEMGFSELGSENAPRAIFMHAGFDLATRFFPFGAGLGALGGQSAVVYDSHFYYEYLISYEWYFNYGMYLTDTFWPKVLAETGFSGALIYLFFLFKIIPRDFKVNVEEYYTAYAILAVFINSLSAPSFNTPLSMLMCLFVLGCTINNKVKSV
jgi:hypothetical protein